MKGSALAIVLSLSAASASASSAMLAKSQMPSIAKTARFLALYTWDARVEELLVGRGASTNAAGRRRPGDPHFEAAKATTLARFASAIDALAAAPDAEERGKATFARMLQDADAKAAAAKLTPEIVDYSDLVAVEVEVMLQRKTSDSTDPAVLKAVEKAGIRRPPRNSPVYEAVEEASLQQFLTARTLAIQSLSTALRGQLQLVLFDSQDAFARDADAAIAACARAKHD